MTLRGALQFATSTQTLRHLTLRVATVNASAKALYESVGFRCYGAEPESLMVDGEYYDEDLMIRVL
ncbi:GNAT family N-acetyltransferase [Arhodomonas sp. AD133]|uniref:GNAT family N-acetyltransferase n=1 Tax=Arhodomonas sp. AD133 TaxID=3415009 RepID=UPI003EBF851A